MSPPVELPRWLDVAVLPAVNLLFALLVAGAVVTLVGFDPGRVLGLLVKGAFGSRAGLQAEPALGRLRRRPTEFLAGLTHGGGVIGFAHLQMAGS